MKVFEFSARRVSFIQVMSVQEASWQSLYCQVLIPCFVKLADLNYRKDLFVKVTANSRRKEKESVIAVVNRREIKVTVVISSNLQIGLLVEVFLQRVK